MIKVRPLSSRGGYVAIARIMIRKTRVLTCFNPLRHPPRLPPRRLGGLTPQNRPGEIDGWPSDPRVQVAKFSIHPTRFFGFQSD